MSVITIPGGTATLRDKLVSERHFRLLEAAFMAASSAMVKVQAGNVDEGATEEERTAAMNAVPLTMAEATSMLDLQDASIVAFLEHWSLKRPLPTISDVSDLDRDLYQALAVATRDRATAAITSKTDFSPDPDRSSPTGDSGSFDTPLKADPESASTTTPPNSGESTVSDASIASLPTSSS